MLGYLSIRNLALIDNITIEFGDGLNILTGETGAGKSIIIDAVGLILGERADKDMIQTGEGFCPDRRCFLSEEARKSNTIFGTDTIYPFRRMEAFC